MTIKKYQEWLHDDRNVSFSDQGCLQEAEHIGYMEYYLIEKYKTFVGIPNDIFRRLNNGEQFDKIRYLQLKNEIIRMGELND